MSPCAPSLEACPGSSSPLRGRRRVSASVASTVAEAPASHAACRVPSPMTEATGSSEASLRPLPPNRQGRCRRGHPGSGAGGRSHLLPPDGPTSLLAVHDSAGRRGLPPLFLAEARLGVTGDAPDRFLQPTFSVFKDGRTTPTYGSHERLLTRSPSRRPDPHPERCFPARPVPAVPPKELPQQPAPRRTPTPGSHRSFGSGDPPPRCSPTCQVRLHTHQRASGLQQPLDGTSPSGAAGQRGPRRGPASWACLFR